MSATAKTAKARKPKTSKPAEPTYRCPHCGSREVAERIYRHVNDGGDVEGGLDHPEDEICCLDCCEEFCSTELVVADSPAEAIRIAWERLEEVYGKEAVAIWRMCLAPVR